MATTPAARPSRPSIRLTALVRAMTHTAVISGMIPGREDDEAGQRDLELVHGHAEEVQDAGRQHLAGHLGRGRHVPDVVDQPHGEHGAGGQHHADSSDESWKIGRSWGTAAATTTATRKPRNMAAPPP